MWLQPECTAARLPGCRGSGRGGHACNALIVARAREQDMDSLSCAVKLCLAYPGYGRRRLFATEGRITKNKNTKRKH